MIKGLAKSLESIWIFVWPGLACTAVDLGWQPFTLVVIQSLPIFFHRLATQLMTTHVDRTSVVVDFKIFFATQLQAFANIVKSEAQV